MTVPEGSRPIADGRIADCRVCYFGMLADMA